MVEHLPSTFSPRYHPKRNNNNKQPKKRTKFSMVEVERMRRVSWRWDSIEVGKVLIKEFGKFLRQIRKWLS